MYRKTINGYWLGDLYVNWKNVKYVECLPKEDKYLIRHQKDAAGLVHHETIFELKNDLIKQFPRFGLIKLENYWINIDSILLIEEHIMESTVKLLIAFESTDSLVINTKIGYWKNWKITYL